jgi:hypothetical protein
MYANRLIVPEMVDTLPKPVMRGERGGGEESMHDYRKMYDNVCPTSFTLEIILRHSKKHPHNSPFSNVRYDIRTFGQSPGGIKGGKIASTEHQL